VARSIDDNRAIPLWAIIYFSTHRIRNWTSCIVAFGESSRQYCNARRNDAFARSVFCIRSVDDGNFGFPLNRSSGAGPKACNQNCGNSATDRGSYSDADAVNGSQLQDVPSFRSCLSLPSPSLHLSGSLPFARSAPCVARCSCVRLLCCCGLTALVPVSWIRDNPLCCGRT
jgi:hypothetical protein